MNLTVKDTLTFRLSPQLKNDLTTEALAKDLKVSAYVESLLMSRELDESGSAITIQSLKERIIQLELENEKLQQKANLIPVHVYEHVHEGQKPSVHANEHVHEAQLSELSDKVAELTVEKKALQQRNYALSEHTKKLVQQRDTLSEMQGKVIPHWMTYEAYKQFTGYINQLMARHKNASAEQVVLSSLAVTLKNDKSFLTVYTLQDFWKRNPDFLTTKTLVK